MISIIMSVITVLSCFAGLTFSVGAETSGDYEYEVLDDGTVSITKYNGDDTEIEIPSEIAKKKVTVIGEYVFRFFADITSVKIPYGVTKIDFGAFADCTGLTSVVIPDSVTEIVEFAFSACSGLTNLIIPNSVTKIGKYAFGGCVGLTSITIPDSVTEICGYGDYGVFSGCTGLKSITISKNITELSGSAFSGCTGLTTVMIPNNINVICQSAFSCCTGLTSLIMPNSIMEIGYHAFSGCTGLTNVAIPDSVRVIDYEAFSDCTGLTSITIPGSVTEIGYQAFGYYDYFDVDNRYKIKKIDNFTICGQPGSVAEEYANENGFKFVDINSCGHTDTCLRNIINETCEQNGYSGDLYCKVCGALIKKGEQTDKTEHQFVNGKCTVCGASEDGTDMKKTIASMSVGDTITFGSYPQTDVTSELGSQLTAAAPSTDEWTSYDYYYDGEQSDYMKYYDLSYNSNTYRGVYFTKYRPYSWDKTDIPNNPRIGSNQVENGYGSNIIYWFRYDPLAWRILDPSTGYIMCEDIIDSQPFNDKYYIDEDDNQLCYNDETYKNYANNWEYSTIRRWLNETFFVTAFSSSERSQIPCTKLTTPAYSTSYSQYDVGETGDYIFLPSYYDMINISYGFSSDNSDCDMNRNAHSSDYAKSQGIAVSGSYTDKSDEFASCYRLRSAGKGSAHTTNVFTRGDVDSNLYDSSHTDFGIRPVLCFNPTSTATPPKTGEYEIKLYSNVPAMIVGKGRTIGAVVQLEHNGKVVDGEGETAYSVVSSNNDIVSTEDISNASDGTSFLINGVEEGEAVITITEHNSGAILSVKVQVDQGILTFNAATLPSYYNRKNEYNGCISGMYIDEFKMTEKDSDNMSVTFNVYNTVNIVGSVDVYGADGKIIRSKQIKRFDGGFVTSITDALVTGYKLIENTVTGDILTYKQEDYSTKTPITVDVPKGGHIEITNDPLYSNTCAVYNFSEFITTSILMFGDVLSVSAETKKEISAQTGKNIVDKFLKQYIASMSGNTCNDKIAKLGEKFVKKLTEKSLKKILASGITGELATFVDDGKAILKECDIDLEKEITSAAGSIGISILEGNLRKAMGPFGSVLDGMFKFTEYLSYTCFLVDVCKVHDDHAFCIYFNDKNGCLCNNEVTVKSYEEDVDLSKLNFVMHSVVMSNDTDLTGYMKDALNKLSDKYIVRNIYLERDGKISQPGQYVQVSIPVPENWSPDRCKLYWVQDDGTLQEISVTVSAGRLEFVTNHFSYYAIVYNEDSAGASEKLEFADNSNIDGRIDEENNRVSVFPSSNAGISFDEFKAMFKGIISVAGEKIEKVFNGMKFMFGDKEYTLILKGDANADSKINASDARTILRIAARLEQPDEITKDAADIDSDGKITSAEARSVLRFAAKLQNKIYE